ncbi:MAG: hypothetical protein ACRC7B_01210, partial [Metamycoplasmataceae bacterium]
AVVVTMTPMTGNEPRFVTLAANSGYTIGNMLSLNSNNFIIPINYVINKVTNVPSNIKPSDIVGDNYKRWPVVSKLFTGSDFNEQMLVNLDIELITITVNSSYQIKLTPLTDFYINGGLDGITSDAFTLAIINLNIITEHTNPQDITLKNLEDSAYIHSIQFLDKLFNLNSLTQTDIDNGVNV